MRATSLRKGLKRGLLTLLETTGDKDERGHSLWRVRCQCGTILKVRSHNLGTRDKPGKVTCGKPVCLKVREAQHDRVQEGPERRELFASAEQRIHRELAQMAARGERVV